jgi:hypothetical protein
MSLNLDYEIRTNGNRHELVAIPPRIVPYTLKNIQSSKVPPRTIDYKIDEIRRKSLWKTQEREERMLPISIAAVVVSAFVFYQGLNSGFFTKTYNFLMGLPNESHIEEICSNSGE